MAGVSSISSASIPFARSANVERLPELAWSSASASCFFPPDEGRQRREGGFLVSASAMGMRSFVGMLLVALLNPNRGD